MLTKAQPLPQDGVDLLWVLVFAFVSNCMYLNLVAVLMRRCSKLLRVCMPNRVDVSTAKIIVHNSTFVVIVCAWLYHSALLRLVRTFKGPNKELKDNSDRIVSLHKLCQRLNPIYNLSLRLHCDVSFAA